MLTAGFHLQRQFAGDSLFLPEPGKIPVDEWVYLVFFQLQKSRQIAPWWSFHLDLGFQTSNAGATGVLDFLETSQLSQTLESMQPGFSHALSFTHFPVYELFTEFQISNLFFIQAGIVHTLQGNSFYKNPVSFYERYFQARQLYREYSTFSAPGVSLEYSGEIYSMKFLYTPGVDTKAPGLDDARRLFFDSFGFKIPHHVIMLKNSFLLSPLTSDLYFFAESPPVRPESTGSEENKFHYGFGAEFTWNITSALGLTAQALYSNGRELYQIVEKSGAGFLYPRLEPIENSKSIYRLESLLGLNFSGVEGFEISLSYYYNGRGKSENEHNELIATLEKSRTGYASSDPAESFDHEIFFYQVLDGYDLFSEGRHFALLNIVNLEAPEFFTWGASVFLSLRDFSFMPAAYINMKIDDHSEAYLQAFYNAGAPQSIFKESLIEGTITGGIEWSF